MGSLSERFHVSCSYVDRLFKKYCGISPMTYFNQKKLEEAARLLKDGKVHKIKDIAEALGYQNQHYFSRSFKTIMGSTPTEYKERE